MSKEKKENTFLNDDLILYLVGFGAVATVLWIIVQRVMSLIHSHGKQTLYAVIATVVLGIIPLYAFLKNKLLEFIDKTIEAGKPDPKILVGDSVSTHEPIFIDEKMRLYHTQVIGSTGSGKTEGIILPWIFDDIERGRGVIIIDGKPEGKFLELIHGKVSKEGRGKDFRCLSIPHLNRSHSFNPFAYGTPDEVTERIFSSFKTENEHYRSVQYSAVKSVLELIVACKQVPSPGIMREMMRSKDVIISWLDKANNSELHADFMRILSLAPEQFQKDFSGILAYLETFTKGEVAPLLNQEHSEIDFEDALLNKRIIYFQLPTLSSPTLSSAIGKLAIQSLASAAGKVQARSMVKTEELFSLYLDDFNDYMYEGFSSVANKVRSAGIGIVFSHQSLGDLNKVSPDFKNIIVENTNTKIIMKINDPDSAEFFSKYIGTRKTEKTTERRTHSLLGSQDTGDQSVRAVEEYIVHPNVFKTEFVSGDAIAILTGGRTPRRVERIRCRFVKKVQGHLPKETKHEPISFVEEAQKFGTKKNPAPESTPPSPEQKNTSSNESTSKFSETKNVNPKRSES